MINDLHRWVRVLAIAVESLRLGGITLARNIEEHGLVILRLDFLVGLSIGIAVC